jgi:hypothetical protein
MDARSVLLGKSESGNHRVTDFHRTMTAEQKAKYDARQAVKSAAFKKKRKSLVGQSHFLWSSFPSSLRRRYRSSGIVNEPNSLMQPQIRQLLQPVATEMADRLLLMAMSSVRAAASWLTTLEVAAGTSAIGSRQASSSEGGSPLTGSDTEAVDDSDADDEIDSKPKPARR